MEYKYDHFGVPCRHKREGMLHYPKYGVWASDYEKDPYRIEWIYFERESLFHPLIQKTPHVCFWVRDIAKAVSGKKLLLPPTPFEGILMAFIEEEGTPIEFFQKL